MNIKANYTYKIAKTSTCGLNHCIPGCYYSQELLVHYQESSTYNKNILP